MEFHLTTPLTDMNIRALSMGDTVLLSGLLYTARDAAHKRILAMLEAGETPPFPFDGQVVYYAGPSPAAPGRVIGSIGPTTSGRMDPYAPALMETGLRCMIGKGARNDAVREAIRKANGVYFVAIGGAAALMSRCVAAVRMVAFPELGAEAVRALTVVNFPVIVGIDSYGRDIYKP
ncbi:MAG: FumA C-terminus/TtdB family hydratase beta subunit [Oscillospiraceae bacterium]|jgi:fumarate hydratase subunit beta|nr:FumA C-terminus/TtdB family hydratase beta subunit [Oscillospiraceae bacterium]